MNYLSLYRKYRPKTFKDVVGQQYIVRILKNSIKNDAIANAYVFAGTKGTGKTSIAKIYANAINCKNNQEGDVCGSCDICKDFIENQVIDVLELDAASNNGVDEIRKISDSVYTLPAKLTKKVYIIDEAHMLTTNAWNALLKVVEEPPKHVIFIFATTEMHKIPPTILSRCQCLRFNKISNSEIAKLLVKVCDKESFKYDEEAIKVIAEIADGSARDALSILEQTATFSNNQINVGNIYKIYGLLSPVDVISFLNLIPNKKNNDLFAKANQYYQTGINFVSFANMIVSILTDKLIFLKTNNYQLLTKTNENSINDFLINDIAMLVKLLDIWQDAYIKLINPTDVHVIFDHALIKSIACFDQGNDSSPQPIKKIVESQPKVEISKEDEEPVIKVEPFILPKIEEKQPQPIEQPKLEEKVEQKEIAFPSIEEILESTVANRDKQATIEAKKFFDDLKNNVISEKAFSCITLASQVLCASQNSIILVFRDELDAKILNKMAFTNDFILTTCHIFRNPKYIVGFSIDQIKKLNDQLKSLTKDSKQNLDVKPLRQILDTDGSIEQLVFNTIYSKLDEKDRK